MNKRTIRTVLFLFLFTIPCFALRSPAHRNQPLFPLHINSSQAQSIGKQIWKNEGKGSIEFLTFWKEGEDWASLGIGHFIWYPEGKQGLFKETFPSLLAYLKEHGVHLPNWLEKARMRGNPWNSREQFYKQINSQRMKELRTFLENSINLQTSFIISRANSMLKKTLEKLPVSERLQVKQQLVRLIASPNGIYAIIDYINFKGIGANEQEAYNGTGWGLIDVLKKMNGKSNGMPALVNFVQTAKDILAQRVSNAPIERNEQQWLQGWHNRLDTYLQPIS